MLQLRRFRKPGVPTHNFSNSANRMLIIVADCGYFSLLAPRMAGIIGKKDKILCYEVAVWSGPVSGCACLRISAHSLTCATSGHMILVLIINRPTIIQSHIWCRKSRSDYVIDKKAFRMRILLRERLRFFSQDQ
jgi:hypothetical protein